MYTRALIFLAQQLKNFVSANELRNVSSANLTSSSKSRSELPSDSSENSNYHQQVADIPVSTNYITTKTNTLLNICSQNENIIVERFGRFSWIQGPGLFLAIPWIDKLKYVVDMRELTLPIPKQHSITQDNVSLELEGVVYFKFSDPYKSVYGVSNTLYAVAQFTQAAMRAVVGKNTLDEMFHKREEMNSYISDALKEIVEPWGITVLRYEITDITLSKVLTEVMSRQASAERKRREDVLHAEALKRGQILESEGLKEKLINQSLGNKIKVENEALAFAQSVKIRAEADKIKAVLEAEGKAKALEIVANVLESNEGKNAAGLELARGYLGEFGKIAQKSHSIIIPKDSGNIAGIITKALQVAQFNLNQKKDGHSTSNLNEDENEGKIHSKKAENIIPMIKK